MNGLSFKCDVNGIEYEYVNPAYTSQECHVCGCLGNRPHKKSLFVKHAERSMQMKMLQK